MRCQYCGFEDSKVLDSRPVEDGRSIRRRRECLSCGKRFTTYEKIEETPLVIVKKDGRRELFDASKLLSGLIKSCDKRPVPLSALEALTDEVEKDLRNSLQTEISSQMIGELVMSKLKKVDEVAYVRFASVYRKFDDVSTFIEEIHKLQQELEAQRK